MGVCLLLACPCQQVALQACYAVQYASTDAKAGMLLGGGELRCFCLYHAYAERQQWWGVGW